jgi:oxygen-independent coproporphyrinogen-3 oxidase
VSVDHLYLHYPFCAKICPYCAFYVERVGALQTQRAVIQALRGELAWVAGEGKVAAQISTIYLGGGTPSLIPDALFEELAAALPRLKPGGEFTLEVNPATVTEVKARAWRAAGVNRISLGAQSFIEKELAMLGRQHSPQQVGETCQLLRQEGFTNINIDLIFGLPDQSLPDWQVNIEAALQCHPEHLSAYGLTYEADTPFFEQLQKGVYRQDEAGEIAMFTWTRARLEEAGLFDYEVSNFAKPGFESAHNLGYWQGADYLGIGPSAVSTVGQWRWKNRPDFAVYVAAAQKGEGGWASLRTEEEEMTPDLRLRERLMFGLRMREGVSRAQFADRHAPALARLLAEGLAEEGGEKIRLTRRGQLVADSVAEFLI